MGPVLPEREMVRPVALYLRFRGGCGCEWRRQHRPDDPGETVQATQLPVSSHRQLHRHRRCPVRSGSQLPGSQRQSTKMDRYRKFPYGSRVVYIYHSTCGI